MILTIRGKNIFGDSKTKIDLLSCLISMERLIRQLPDDVKIHNQGDDYIDFIVEPKDKDDRKYYKSLGFRREEL